MPTLLCKSRARISRSHHHRNGCREDWQLVESDRSTIMVDITNYVMEEYGQPMHAYDLSTIAGHKIVVRRAKDGDEFQTLDGQMRKLDSECSDDLRCGKSNWYCRYHGW